MLRWLLFVTFCSTSAFASETSAHHIRYFTNLVLMRTTTYVDYQRTEKGKKRIGAIEEFRFSNRGYSFANFVLGVTSDLLQFLTILMMAFVISSGLFSYKCLIQRLRQVLEEYNIPFSFSSFCLFCSSLSSANAVPSISESNCSCSEVVSFSSDAGLSGAFRKLLLVG